MSSTNWPGTKPEAGKYQARVTPAPIMQCTPTRSGRKLGSQSLKVGEAASPKRRVRLKKAAPGRRHEAGPGERLAGVLGRAVPVWQRQRPDQQFLRQSPQEEMESGPSMLQPKISNKSEQFRRRFAYYDFPERNRYCATRKFSRVENQRDT